MEVGLCAGDFVLDGYQPPFHKKRAYPQFSARVYCGQKAVCINQNTTRYTEVGLSLGDIVLDGDPAPSPLKGHSPLFFGQCPLRPNGWVD